MLKGWCGWLIIDILSFLSACSLGWDRIRDEGGCDGPKLLGYPILLQCSPATCITKYVMQRNSHKNKRDIFEIRVSAPPDLYQGS